jgi:hypothetical protein
MRVSSSLQDIRGRTCEKDSASVDSLFVTMLDTPSHRSANVVDGGRKRRLWRMVGSERNNGEVRLGGKGMACPIPRSNRAFRKTPAVKTKTCSSAVYSEVFVIVALGKFPRVEMHP